MRYGDKIPAGIGYATVLAEHDWETYSEAGFVWNDEEQKWEQLPGLSNQKKGLKGAGLYNYVTHPTFEVLSLAYDLKNGYGPRLWRPGMPDPTDLFEHVAGWPGIDIITGTNPNESDAWLSYDVPGLLEGWRVGFELEVWNTFCVQKLGWPPLNPLQMRCAMAKSKQNSYPGALAEAGPAIHLPKQYYKDPEGEKLINMLTVPKKPSKKSPARRWTRATAPQEFAKFDAYNVGDIITESQASIRLPDLPPREIEIWQVDQRINRRGMQIDLVAVENCISIVLQAREKYNAELRYITNGRVSEYTKAADTIEWMKTRGVYLSALDEEVVEDELKKQHPKDVLRVLKIRQTLSYGSVNKLFPMRAQTNADGRLRDQYDYHGTHTKLWNSHNVQVANLYKGKLDKPEKVEQALACIASGSLDYVEAIYGDALETVADCLRSLIIAPPGKDLISADFTAIQAVVTSALAGEDWRTEVFRTHGKIYEAMASELTGNPLAFYLDYRRQHGKHHDDRQDYGKIPTLASDFGAWIDGWKRFGAEKIGDDEAIKRLILKTRAKIPWVVEFWGGQVRNKFKSDERPEYYGLEGAIVSAILDPSKCFGYRGVRYQMHGRDLYCQPPTDGEPIIYHEVELEQSRRDYARPWEYSISYMGWNSNSTKGKGGWVRMPLYGGVATQNVVSAVSREFQANTLVALDKTDIYVPVMHTHDENLCEVNEGRGSIPEYLAIVNRIPSWAYHWDGKFKGQPWPVKAPGAERTKRYGKWE